MSYRGNYQRSGIALPSQIQYTLFLKEVGLPVSEAVKFWQREYSQAACSHGNQGGGCTHDWKRDERRYTYSIRHLYGLEGSRVNYRAHSCRSLQECSMGHGEEGGCPFRHFDGLHLNVSMSHAGITSDANQQEIADLAQRGSIQTACQTFFKKSAAFHLENVLNTPARGQSVVCNGSVDEEDGDCQPLSIQKKPRLVIDDNRENNRSVINHEEGNHFTCMENTKSEKDSNDNSVVRTHTDITKGHITGLDPQESTPTTCQISFKRSHNSKDTTTESDPNHESVQRMDAECQHPGSSSNILSRPRKSKNDDRPVSQTIAILKDIQIQKPVDYFRSYIQLIGSLRQLQKEEAPNS